MKKYSILFSIIFAIVCFTTSCDKVDKIYEPSDYQTELDTVLYPGNWQTYLDTEWPNFDTITASSDRNILIEDFTGHNCQYCPQAGTDAHAIHTQYPDRVFISSIHSSPTGITGFQAVNAQYPVDFTNEHGVELGTFFGQMPSSGFFGNPSVGCSRIKVQGGQEIYYPSGILANEVSNNINSPLKVSIKSVLNYFDETKGAFLHTAVHLLDPQLNNLGLTVVLQQDSLVAPQNVLGTYTPDYVHRDIHRKHLNTTWGTTLTEELKAENGDYYLDFSFVVPDELTIDGSAQFSADNMHVLVYVYDKDTYEIYQVVENHFE